MKAFNGDQFIELNITSLIQRHGVQSAFETGTFEADTTVWFGAYGGKSLKVVSAELNQKYYQQAVVKLRTFPNVSLVNLSSPEAIKIAAPSLPGRILFYLDAHWNDYNPLLDELDAIFRLVQFKLIQVPIIAIHDWKVEGTVLGYDHFDRAKTIPYTYDLIHSRVEKIYSGGQKISYNSDDQSGGAKRGVIYIEV